MEKRAYVFPGQGAQFVGMGHDLYQSSKEAKRYFDLANDILGFDITKIMFAGTDDELKQTKVTQPAVFLHSVISAFVLGKDFNPYVVAGHSLGEFSALVAAKALSFEDGLRLVSIRAFAMQKACEKNPSTMAAVLGLDDKKVEDVCATIDGVVVPANYNCPGQLVISGSFEAVAEACEKLKEAGVTVAGRRRFPLSVYATRKRRTPKGYRGYTVRQTDMPYISECRWQAVYRYRRYKEKSHSSAYIAGALDAVCTKYGERRRYRVCRTRSGSGIAGADKEDYRLSIIV